MCGSSWLGLRLQAANIRYERANVGIDQLVAECRHPSRRAPDDAIDDELVVALGVHELRAAPLLAASGLMALAAAVADEQNLAVCGDLRPSVCRARGRPCFGGTAGDGCCCVA